MPQFRDPLSEITDQNKENIQEFKKRHLANKNVFYWSLEQKRRFSVFSRKQIKKYRFFH